MYSEKFHILETTPNNFRDGLQTLIAEEWAWCGSQLQTDNGSISELYGEAGQVEEIDGWWLGLKGTRHWMEGGEIHQEDNIKLMLFEYQRVAEFTWIRSGYRSPASKELFKKITARFPYIWQDHGLPLRRTLIVETSLEHFKEWLFYFTASRIDEEDYHHRYGFRIAEQGTVYPTHLREDRKRHRQYFMFHIDVSGLVGANKPNGDRPHTKSQLEVYESMGHPMGDIRRLSDTGSKIILKVKPVEGVLFVEIECRDVVFASYFQEIVSAILGSAVFKCRWTRDGNIVESFVVEAGWEADEWDHNVEWEEEAQSDREGVALRPGKDEKPVQLVTPAKVGGLMNELTEDELKVLRIVATGKPYREIATELSITLATVKERMERVFDKLDLETRNRARAVYVAQELKLI